MLGSHLTLNRLLATSYIASAAATSTITPFCKAPDVVLTLTSRFRVQSELEAHQKPPVHETRTRVATGFSTTGKGTITLTKTYIKIDRSGHTTPLSLLQQHMS